MLLSCSIAVEPSFAGESSSVVEFGSAAAELKPVAAADASDWNSSPESTFERTEI